jgi:xanthine dehydrogenase accessory factor
MRELLTELSAAIDEGRPCVYCAVVETRGSTPQKAGAAMLVFPDGSQRGTLGGGCVEAEVKQRALRALSDRGKPEMLTFNLDDNYGWDDGLICGGRMSMLVEPLHGQASGSDRRLHQKAYFDCLRKLLEAGRGGTEAVVIKGENGVTVGQRYLFNHNGDLAAQLGEQSCPGYVRDKLQPVSQRPAPGSHGGVAYLPLLPRITLLVVGGGHVGQAVGRLAAETDFDVWVVDDRETYASKERFPFAKAHIVGETGATLKRLVAEEVTPSTYCIIVTRGHAHDEEALYHLAKSNAGYVGMIGSKRKIRMIFEDLIAKGTPAAALEKIHAPLGFDIGSQTVPEIAISIMAELIAHRNLGVAEPAPRKPIKPGNLPS